MDTDFDKMLNALDADGKTPERAYWKPGSNEEGEWTIRLLPPLSVKNEQLPYFRHQIHYINNKVFECINQTLVTSTGEIHKSESCPFCNMKEKLYKQGERGSEEWVLAGKLKARNTYDYRAIVRTLEDNPDSPRIVRLPNGIHDEIIEKLKSKRHGNIFDLKDGRDIVLIKKGKGIGSNYSMDMLEKSPLFEDSSKLKDFALAVKDVEYNVLINFPTREECEVALKEFLGHSDDVIADALKARTNEKTTESVVTTKPTENPTLNKPKTTSVKKENVIEDTDSMLDELFTKN